MGARRVVEGTHGGFIADSRQFPVVGVRWSGRLEELALVDAFGEWLSELIVRLEAERRLAVLVIDVREASRPTAAFRRELTRARAGQRERLDRWVIRDIVVTENVLMRRVLRTLQWVTPWVHISPVGALEEGFELAEGLLRERGEADLELAPSALFGEPSRGV